MSDRRENVSQQLYSKDVVKGLVLSTYKVFHGLVCVGLFFEFCIKDSILNTNEIVLSILFFYLLLVVLTKIYAALNVGNERISELLISQAIALLLVYGLTFIVFQVLKLFSFNYLGWALSLLLTLGFTIIWTILGNKLFFSLFSALKTILINGSKKALDILDLIRLYPKRFNIVTSLSISELMKDMSILEKYGAVLLNGVDTTSRTRIMKFCLSRDIIIYIRPKLGDIMLSGSRPTKMLNIPMLTIQQKNRGIVYEIVKRAGDIVLSSVGLLVASPIMLLVGLTVKLADGGPAIYKQVRLTKGGNEFWLIKFRSMRVDAESDGVARLTTRNDNRITPVGHFLRKTRLDELPQLINILRGEMSFVGPRPERPEIARKYEESLPEFKIRLLCKAGLTGYAQVYGRYNSTPYNKLQMDLIYIMNRSLFLDLKLLFATFRVLFMPENIEGVSEGQVTAID